MATATRTLKRDATSPPDHDQQIRTRAYELLLQRGGEDGHDIEDWLRAEAEISRRQQAGGFTNIRTALRSR